MNLLAIETSTEACSVALQVDDKITQRHVVEAKIHTKILVPAISDLLKQSNIEVADLHGIVLGNGPGSFIGMRIGASVAQGLAYGAKLRILPVSSLAAVAAEALATTEEGRICVAQDAHMGEVYLGQFDRGHSGFPAPADNEKIVPIGDLADLLGDGIGVGAGWRAYRAQHVAASESLNIAPDILWPKAEFVLRLGVRAAEAGDFVSPDKLQPAYLRMQVATPKRG